MTMSAERFSWRGNKLFYHNHDSGFSVVQDSQYPQMYRVQSPDGTISDMVNLTRAKDAAAYLARELDTRQKRREGSPVR